MACYDFGMHGLSDFRLIALVTLGFTMLMAASPVRLLPRGAVSVDLEQSVAFALAAVLLIWLIRMNGVSLRSLA